MTEERINNCNDHATHMADIALRILAGDEKILRVSGVKEQIALYLLIPYMTLDTLTTPGERCVIRKGHAALGVHSTVHNIMIEDAHERLVELFKEITTQQ